jgi:NAD(P)-dependent dehydrogenase (short-subunit alcohol dehydrogenase family)
METIADAKDVAAQVNGLGRFDAVIHNAAVGYREPHHLTADGLPHVFSINTLAAYILTALIERPKRLVYLSSGMHQHADASVSKWTGWIDGRETVASGERHDRHAIGCTEAIWHRNQPAVGLTRQTCRSCSPPGSSSSSISGPRRPLD